MNEVDSAEMTRDMLMRRLTQATLETVRISDPTEQILVIVTSVCDSVPIDFLAKCLYAAKSVAHKKMGEIGLGGIMESYTQTEMNLAQAFSKLCEDTMEEYHTDEAKEEAVRKSIAHLKGKVK